MSAEASPVVATLWVNTEPGEQAVKALFGTWKRLCAFGLRRIGLSREDIDFLCHEIDSFPPVSSGFLYFRQVDRPSPAAPGAVEREWTLEPGERLTMLLSALRAIEKHEIALGHLVHEGSR